jgi:hypothetical protein
VFGPIILKKCFCSVREIVVVFLKKLGNMLFELKNHKKMSDSKGEQISDSAEPAVTFMDSQMKALHAIIDLGRDDSFHERFCDLRQLLESTPGVN